MSGCVCDGPALTLVSLFDGIAGFPLAFSRAGVRTVATVEIDQPAAGVAADHFPEAKSFADVTEVTPDDLLAAGFCPVHGVVSAGWPCTDLSLAGLRIGLGGARSGLVGEVFRLLAGLRPRWVVLENVPGLLSSVCPCPGGGRCDAGACTTAHTVRGGACGRRVRGGRYTGPGRCMALHGGGMGTVLRRLGECGYGLAYRVLDAQHFGVPQRRRRVVIVGRLGDAAGPAEVLLEPESGGWHSAPRGPARTRTAGRSGVSARGTGTAVNALTTGSITKYDDNTAQAGHLVAPTLQGGGKRGYRVDAETAAGGGLIATTLTAREGKGPDSDVTTTLVTHALTAEGADASEDRTGRGTPLVPVAFGHTNGLDVQASETVTPTLRAGHGVGGGSVAAAAAVRRLTPVECERLQGYPDGWTAVSHGREQADAPRYRQLGNSIAVPMFAWVARRIVAVGEGAL